MPVFDAPRPMIEAPIRFSASVLVGFGLAFSWFFALCFENELLEFGTFIIVAESKILAELYSALLYPLVVNGSDALELFSGHRELHWYLLEVRLGQRN